MDSNILRGKHVLVLGLGLHGGGLAVARWLVRQGVLVTVSDAKSRSELKPSIDKLGAQKINFVLGGHPNSLLTRCDLIMQNPGVPRELPLLLAARARGIPIENEASLFLKLCSAQLTLGVTGSKGKSSTTALLGDMVQRHYRGTIIAGNIGDTVMFNVLDRVRPVTPVVLELSSWHLELTGEHKLAPRIAVITNVLPDHLNRYRSYADYARAKQLIVRPQSARDMAVLNYDDPIVRRMAKHTRAQVYWFSLSKVVPRGVYVAKGQVWWRAHGTRRALFKSSDLTVPGQHMLANALAAAAAAMVAKVPPANIRTAVRAWRGLHDRLELIRIVRGVAYYNDTAATAPAAVQAALAALQPRSLVLIAGGVDKGLRYDALARDIRRLANAVVLLPGSATAKLQRHLRGFKPQFLASSMLAAVKLASKLAPPQAVVVLSPGAASFNLFKHEFDRGQAFRRVVARL